MTTGHSEHSLLESFPAQQMASQRVTAVLKAEKLNDKLVGAMVRVFPLRKARLFRVQHDSGRVAFFK